MTGKDYLKKNGLFVALVALLVFLDHWTKLLTKTHLSGRPSLVLIKNVFQLTYVENRGAAFGILQNQKIFLVIITVIALGAILVYFEREPWGKGHVMVHIICVLLMAGAIGNFIDRILQGYVVDLFDFCLINFPVFNVADIYLVVGCGLIILYGFFLGKEEQQEGEPAKEHEGNQDHTD